jgi:hypothetical protein
MTNEPEAMQEIHEIRRQIYEKTKNLSMEERLELTRREAREVMEMYGLELKLPERVLVRKIQ